MGRLWDYYDGEPFFENAPLAIVGLNPEGKKGRKSMAARKRKVSRRRGRKAAPRRRKAAPRRIRVSKRTSGRRKKGLNVLLTNPRRYRRNPAGFSLAGLSLPPLQSVGFAAGGYIGTPMVEGFLNGFLPLSLTTNSIGKYAVRIASMLGLSFAVKMVLGRSAANMVAIGGGAYVLTTAITEFAPGIIPGMGAYVIPGEAVDQLPAPRPHRQLSAYTEGIGAPDFGARNTARSAMRSQDLVAARFRRLQ